MPLLIDKEGKSVKSLVSGMIHRRRGDKDRRQALLWLTETGRKVLAAAPDGVHAQFLAQFSAPKDWEQQMLVAALERLADMLDNNQEHAAAVFDMWCNSGAKSADSLMFAA